MRDPASRYARPHRQRLDRLDPRAAGAVHWRPRLQRAHPVPPARVGDRCETNVERLLALEPEIVVPGHGDVCAPEVLQQCADYLDVVLDTARAGRAAGLTP